LDETAQAEAVEIRRHRRCLCLRLVDDAHRRSPRGADYSRKAWPDHQPAGAANWQWRAGLDRLPPISRTAWEFGMNLVDGASGKRAPRQGPFIGRPLPRLEDLRLVRGQGRYTDDVSIAGQAFAVFVRSPHAHARIGS